MAKEYAKSFYASALWHRTKNSYLKSVGRLCERCLKRGEFSPAKIVHHKVYINERNIGDTDITLSFDNLEALCHECHQKEHTQKAPSDRYYFTETGECMPPMRSSH